MARRPTRCHATRSTGRAWRSRTGAGDRGRRPDSPCRTWSPASRGSSRLSSCPWRLRVGVPTGSVSLPTSFYHRTPDLVKDAHREVRTPTRRHSRATGHTEHFGDTGAQTFWPNVTSRSLYPIQYRDGSFARKAISVSSGVRVRTYPRRFEIRWTCVSTQIPGLSNPIVTTRFAVFR